MKYSVARGVAMTACRGLPLDAIATTVDDFCVALEQIKRLTEASELSEEGVHVVKFTDDIEDAGPYGLPGFVAA